MFDLKSFGLDKASKRARAYRIASAHVAAWRAEAQESGLRNTLRTYKQGVVIREVTPSFVIVALSGELPNLLERGIPPHDMRKYLLKTVRAGAAPIRYVKTGKRKGQPYRYIMFRKKVSEIERMGYDGAKQEAQSLEATTSLSGGKLLYGSRMPRGRAAHYISKGGVRSVSDALEGMVRLVGRTQAGTPDSANTTYATWRTVSTLRPDAWQHSGFTALRLAQKVLDNVPTILEEAGV